MKYLKRILPVILAIIMVLTWSLSAVAIETPSSKEEVIYINLSAEGVVDSVYAVNIFGKGNVLDYGDYSSIELLNSTEQISKDGDVIRFETEKDRVYYKGKMNNITIPWNVSIKFFMDGTEYSAKDIAGKSGKVEIHFTVTKNENYKGNFFETYALQSSFSLDTKKCSNIVAEGATLANVGSKKQISYTMLPGKGVDAVITANVVEFEMSAVSINGIPLSMNIQVDDEALMSQVNQLLDAIHKLDDGAGELKNGAEELKDAAGGKLKTGINDLVAGSDKMNSGVKALNDGILLLENGLNTLNNKSDVLVNGSAEVKNALKTIKDGLSFVSSSNDKLDELVEGSSQIKDGIETLYEGVKTLDKNVTYEKFKEIMLENGLDIDYLKSSNDTAIVALNEQIKTFKKNIQVMESFGADASELKKSVEQFENLILLLKGSNGTITGVEAYLTEADKGVDQLVDGIELLKEKYVLLDEGISELVTVVKDMLPGMAELKSGIDTLVTEYEKLDSGINEYTNGVASIVAGYSEVSKGTKELLSGSSTLKDGTSKFADGVNDLINGVDALYGGTSELKDGTSEMRNETEGIDDKISDQIDEMIAGVTGGHAEVVSFVSEKNTDVKAVQFVIQTDAVEISVESLNEPVVEVKLTFWQKILRLFGLY
ncbi:MAG: hypothetical protein E7388_01555 [Ruminococcaceae bacterium]|nr:hypothetical protein [Oscillospiraceae bacterium]